VKNISVRRELAAIPSVFADEHQLQQVFLNIIINAEQAMESFEREAALAVKTEMATADRVRVVIADNGPGIPSQIIEKLFDPFFTTKPVGQGTGLGLSISYGIIKEHDGTIRAESESGRGARFVIDLPVKSS
jgi:signal transduction histidine kinase